MRNENNMLIQLCYASRRVEHQNDLLQDLSDILAQARSFNEAHQIYGVLYYAEGIYFQCLEGEQAQLEALFASIRKDPRHTEIHRFQDHMIDQVHFSRWSMKYVNQHGKVRQFFDKQGLNAFLPHELNAVSIQSFLELLLKLNDADEKDQKVQVKKGLNHRGYQNFF